MWSQLSGTVSESTKLHFEINDVLPATSHAGEQVVSRISRLLSFEQVWLDRLSQVRLGGKVSNNQGG
jgi:hypothetical protein